MTRMSSRWCAAALIAAASTVPSAQQGPRPAIPMDPERARGLYVSDRPEDHPPANYEGAIAAKAEADKRTVVARNKKSITCNLREPEGQELIRREDVEDQADLADLASVSGKVQLIERPVLGDFDVTGERRPAESGQVQIDFHVPADPESSGNPPRRRQLTRMSLAVVDAEGRQREPVPPGNRCRGVGIKAAAEQHDSRFGGGHSCCFHSPAIV